MQTANESRGLNGPLPPWLQAASKLGVPAVIALFLIWFVTQALARDIHTLVIDHQDQRFFLRAICLNTAHSEADRAACQPQNGGR